MKTSLLISFMFCLAVGFGTALYTAQEHEQYCLSKDPFCGKYGDKIACLQSVDFTTEADKQEIKAAIKRLTDEQDKCPGDWVKSDNCIRSVVGLCTDELYILQMSSNRAAICNSEIDRAEKCLLPYNNSCTAHWIGSTIGAFDHYRKECREYYDKSTYTVKKHKERCLSLNPCPKYNDTIACLRKFESNNEADNQEINAAIKTLTDQRENCPGDFVMSDRCIRSVVGSCLSKMMTTFLTGKKSDACNQVDQVEVCVLPYKNTCTAEMIDGWMGEFRSFREECQTPSFWRDH